MYVFARVFFQMNPCEHYFFCTGVVSNLYITMLAYWKLILAYLIALWKVRVKIIFSCKPAIRSNFAVHSKPCLYHILNRFFIYYWQDSGHSNTYLTCLGVRLRAEFGRTHAE